jgi:class 3 adenylate cyclase
MQPPMQPPSGTVTFLFTDVEGSTVLWDRHPTAMRDALAEHDRLIRAAVDAHRGYVFTTAGDSFAVAFEHVRDALDAALEIQFESARSGRRGGVAGPRRHPHRRGDRA